MQMKKKCLDVIDNISQISLHSNTTDIPVGNECDTNSGQR